MDDFAEFRHFRYLLAIAEYGGFRAAAEALHTSQPSLSRQIKEFQDRYRLRLFHRLKDGRIALTPVGEALRVIAKDVLETRATALAALDAIQRGEAESMKIGCTPFIDHNICRRAADIQKALVPASSIRFTRGETSSVLSELRLDRLDAAVTSLPVNDEQFHVDIVKRERLVVCLRADHPSARKSALNGADLTENLAVFRQPSQHPEAHKRLREILAEFGVHAEEQSHASHPHELQEAVLNGEGFALIREGTSLIQGLTTRPVAGADWTVDTAFVFKLNPKSKVLPVIAKILRREFLLSSGQQQKKTSLRHHPDDPPTQMKLIS